MKRITFNKFNSMKVDAQRELLHNIYAATDSCDTVKNQMAFAFQPWKTAYDDMVEAYDTAFKSPETDEIHTLDAMCDNLLASGHGVANGLAKSPDPQLANAAKAILQAYKSFKVNYNTSYIMQKPQVDALLNALLVTNRQSVELCGLLAVYERVQSLNDRIHELVDQRDQTLPDPQRTLKRETAITRCLDLFDYINGYWLVTLHMTNVPIDLEQFFITTDNIFKRYERVLGIGSGTGNGSSGSGNESGGTGSNGATGEEEEGSTGEGTEELPGSPSNPQPGEGTGGENATPSVPGDSVGGESNGETHTITWYTPTGTPIKWYDLAPGAEIPAAPAAPEGYRWPTYPSTMPNRDLDIMPEPIQA